MAETVSKAVHDNTPCSVWKKKDLVFQNIFNTATPNTQDKWRSEILLPNITVESPFIMVCILELCKRLSWELRVSCHPGLCMHGIADMQPSTCYCHLPCLSPFILFSSFTDFFDKTLLFWTLLCLIINV